MKNMNNDKMSMKQITRIGASIVALTGLTYIFGFACAPTPFKASNNSSVSSVIPNDFDDEQPVVSGVKTAGVGILSQSYASLVSSLQLANPSAASRTEFDRQLGNLSDSGKPATIGASYSIAHSTLAAQVCLDKVTAELNLQPAQKTIFNAITLNAAPATSVNEANLQQTINRLARALWQRDETAAERQMLISAVNDAMTDDAQNNANKTQEAMMFLCTAMASSTSGLQL